MVLIGSRVRSIRATLPLHNYLDKTKLFFNVSILRDREFRAHLDAGAMVLTAHVTATFH